MNSKYILSIEDNQVDITLMKRIFNNKIPDYSVKHISDGEEAVNYLESEEFRGDTPKLILLDIKMPRLDGLEILKQFRTHKEYMNIPVVILSSSDIKNDRDTAYDLGANSFLEKPKSFVELCKALPILIEYWIVYNK